MSQEERRTASVETVLVTLGELKNHAEHIKAKVDSLDIRVGIQNGKVGRLERWQSFIQGSLAIIILLVIPIVINFVSSWLSYQFGK